MAKSNYPNKLDTSVEIPVIRDNITEIGSDVLNSLRSAIFNIERTLGINPQGAAGNTVASRINNALDDNGNITKDALDRSGLLSGPISNEDVSKVAGISEEKLNLNFPTQLLQDQISIIDNRIALFIISLEELNALLSAHVHPDAKNRHYAKAITVESAAVNASSAAGTTLQEGTLQEALEDLYNAHINYTGEGVDAENNSHNAGQLYYDNEKTIDIISSSSIQGAIDEIAGLQGRSLRDSILNLNSNGIIRTGSTFDEFEENDCGAVVVSASEVTWAGPSGKSREKIAFFTNPVPDGTIEPFDILTILDSPNSIDNREYLIESVDLLPSGGVKSVTIFGGPKFPMEVGINARVSKSIYTVYNENGLNCVSRPRYHKSNTPDIQVANPNAATIISSGIRASNIVNSSSNILSIEVDGTLHNIDIYDPDVEIQTIDTIVNKINSSCVSSKLNAFAYKVRALKCYELAITHILPNFSDDFRNRTLKIVEGSSGNSAHEALGLGYILDRKVEGLTGNACHINGKIISSFGNIKKYTFESVALNVGTTDIVTDSLNFLNEEIRAGDLCTVEGSSEDGDNGTYRIHAVDDNTLVLDSTGSTFSGLLGEDAAIFIQRCSAPVGELEFQGTHLFLVDVFLTDLGDINFSKRAKMLAHLYDPPTGLKAVITDISRGFITDEDKYKLRIYPNGEAALEELSSGDEGERIYVATTGRYKVFSVDKYNYIILDILADGPPSIEISTIIEGNSEIQDDVMHLSRAVYSSEFGQILAGPSGELGVPLIIDKRTTGTVDDTIISENILERYIQGPRNELRGSGIIRDLNIVDSNSVIDVGDGETCQISVSPGVGVINGVRIEYLGINNLFYNYTNSPTSNFYVAIDGKGCLLVAPEIFMPDLAPTAQDSDYVSPFFNQNVAHIAYIEIDTSWATDPIVTDLRLFVDHLDYKAVGDITVSNDNRFSHFTGIKEAVAYARRYQKMFPDMVRPSITVKEGVYEISETLIIDFDLKFSGAGPQTILKRGGDLSVGHATKNTYSPVFMIGSGTPEDPDPSSLIRNGTTFENFTYKLTDDTLTSGVGATFLLAQEVSGLYGVSVGGNTIWNGGSNHAMFRFDKINFEGEKLDDHNYAFEWGEEAILIGHEPPPNGRLYGNVVISNCFFNWFGFGFGPCRLNQLNEYQNIVISNNIALNVWGDTGTISGDNRGICYAEPADFLDVTGDGISFARFIEVGNVSDDQ